MTQLKKEVTRITDVLSERGRRLVITLVPGGTVMVREEGRRTKYSTSIASVYLLAVKRTVAVQMVEKNKAKEQKKLHKKLGLI